MQLIKVTRDWAKNCADSYYTELTLRDFATHEIYAKFCMICCDSPATAQ